jgi:flavodoxin
MRVLIAYYSLGGTTKKLATVLASKLGADVDPIYCSEYGGGVMSFLKACYDSITGRLPTVIGTSKAVENYDLVLVGAPIWAGHIATPARAYLKQRKGQFPTVGYFVTYGGSNIERALAEFAEIGGQVPQATLALRTADVVTGNLDQAVASFVRDLAVKKAA